MTDRSLTNLIPATDIAGLILAGGRSTRFGSPKAQAMLDGATLAVRVTNVLTPHVGALAVAGGGLDNPAIVTLADPPGVASGPLAGILAGLDWAVMRGFAWLATAPCDAPLLPHDLIPRLVDVAQRAQAPLVFAATADGVHPLCSVWRTSLAAGLRHRMSDGSHPPVYRVGDLLGAHIVMFDDAEAFLNINTPDDLRRAADILARKGRTE